MYKKGGDKSPREKKYLKSNYVITYAPWLISFFCSKIEQKVTWMHKQNTKKERKENHQWHLNHNKPQQKDWHNIMMMVICVLWLKEDDVLVNRVWCAH